MALTHTQREGAGSFACHTTIWKWKMSSSKFCTHMQHHMCVWVCVASWAETPWNSWREKRFQFYFWSKLRRCCKLIYLIGSTSHVGVTPNWQQQNAPDDAARYTQHTHTHTIPYIVHDAVADFINAFICSLPWRAIKRGQTWIAVKLLMFLRVKERRKGTKVSGCRPWCLRPPMVGIIIHEWAV